MNVIVVNEEMRAQLLAMTDSAELRDEAGNFLGRFLPPPPEIPEHGLSKEEIESLLAPDRQTYTTAEVLAYIKGLVK